MPTIKEAIENALSALQSSGFPEGGAVYDDLKQALADLENGASVDEPLSA